MFFFLFSFVWFDELDNQHTDECRRCFDKFHCNAHDRCQLSTSFSVNLAKELALSLPLCTVHPTFFSIPNQTKTKTKTEPNTVALSSVFVLFVMRFQAFHHFIDDVCWKSIVQIDSLNAYKWDDMKTEQLSWILFCSFARLSKKTGQNWYLIDKISHMKHEKFLQSKEIQQQQYDENTVWDDGLHCLRV